MQLEISSELNDVLEEAKVVAEQEKQSVSEVLKRALDIFRSMDTFDRLHEEHKIHKQELKKQGITIPDYTEEDIVRFVKEVREERRLAEISRR